MKKLLFIGMSLNIGGAEKSLVNLLNMIDFTEYSVDLLLFQKKGAFLQQIPPEVNIIEDKTVKVLFQSARDSIKQKKVSIRILKLIVARYVSTLINSLIWKQFDQIRLHRWSDCYKHIIPACSAYYDVAVAYSGGDTAYYMVDKVNAKRKIYYFHSDYSQIDIDAKLEKIYVDRADLVVTISEKCKESLIKLFPEKKNEIIVLNNLSSPIFIQKLAKEYIPSEFDVPEGVLKITSVGRLIHIKGFDIAVEVAKILKVKGVKFCWVVVGEGEERNTIEKKINKYGLEKNFILVGQKKNPYPYILNADLLLQTSRFEGKSVVLDEAKILEVPAIVTDYNSAHDQIKNGVDGFIVEMNQCSIANKICECAENREIINKIKKGIRINEEIQNIDRYMRCLVEDNFYY